ncbi:MAG: alpha/beta hydrolase family protein, partial [Promethearchaeota archaeon]
MIGNTSDSKKNKKLKISFLIALITFSLFLLATQILNNIEVRKKNTFKENSNLELSNGKDVDILKFWKREMKRVNSTDLNIEFGKNSTLKYTNPYTDKKYKFTAQEITFDSPNWADTIPSVITLHGYLLYPEKFTNKNNPGCLCMHGLNGNANASFPLAYPYLEKGFIVLCHSHPGHGKSEGAEPEPKNFYTEGPYNKTAHYYLTLCGAIQGLRVLENLTLVNNSKIMVTGGSYGALNTMWLSGVCGERIAGALPYIAIGDLKKVLKYPEKLLFWVWNKSPEEIPDDYWENQGKYFDPMYYLNSPKVPKILWQIGTNDEFFPYSSINATYEAVSHDEAYLQIFPDGHHGFNKFENNTKFFIDYCINNGPRPPTINVKDHEKKTTIAGKVLNVEVEIDSDEDIASVQVCYKYVNIIGASWQFNDLKKGDDGKWKGSINPGIITSKVDYYIIVTLKGEEQVWFSSEIITGGILISNFTIPFYILLVAFIALPSLYLIWRRYKKNVRDIKAENQKKAKKFLILELSLIGTIEFSFFLSLILPWAVFENGGVTWNHIYVFNNFFTWKMVWGEIAVYLTAIFIISWILIFHLSLMKPMLSGLMLIWYPLFVFFIFGLFTALLDPRSSAANFGTVYPGIGLFIMFFCCISL